MTIKLLCVLGIIRAMYSFVVWFVKGIKELSDKALPSLPSLGFLYAPVLSTLLIRPTPPPQDSLGLHLVSWRLIHNTKQI